MTSSSTIQRIIALITGFPATAWRGTAGKHFRRGLKAASDVSESFELKEKAERLSTLAWKRAEGEGFEKLNRAILDEAEAEKVRGEAELQRRTLESQVRKTDAEVREIESKTEVNESQALLNRAQALKTLLEGFAAAGVSLHKSEDGKLHVLPAPPTANGSSKIDVGDLMRLLGDGAKSEDKHPGQPR